MTSTEPKPVKPDTGDNGTAVRRANKRGAARLAAVQALYQMEVGGTNLPTTLDEFEAHRLGQELDGETYLPSDPAYFRDLVSGVVREQRRIDRLVDRILADGWPLKRIDATLRAVLRVGGFELMFRQDVPPAVAISEMVDVARAFFDDGDEVGIANAVLDEVRRRGGESRGA